MSFASGIQFRSYASASDPFRLECGATFENIDVAYETYGSLNDQGTNAILVCHALTGDAHAAGPLQKTDLLLKRMPAYAALKDGQPGWWDSAIGPGKAIDTDRYFVVCSNILGSCYGTTGPRSVNPETRREYNADFPQVSVRDMVRLQKMLVNSLGISRLLSVVGGSLGGMQALEWALMYPDIVSSIIPIATSVQHSPWAIGFNHMARSAILNDPEYRAGNYNPKDIKGLGIARQIGMISYRSDVSFLEKFQRERLYDDPSFYDAENLFQVESYLNYQGQKLMNRFDPNSYIILSRALDQHDVARDRDNLSEVLRGIRAKTLCIGINSDILYPAREQQEIAQLIGHASYAEIDSSAGHDAFLIEFDQMQKLMSPFLYRVSKSE